jgi:hypothetical protein
MTVTHITGLKEQYKHSNRKPSLKQIFGALQNIIAQHDQVYIVVDALDECRNDDGTRDKMINRLCELQDIRYARIMVTSRYMSDIEGYLTKTTAVEIQANQEDVKQFIAGQIYRLHRCIKRRSELPDLVQNKISEAVDGMYPTSPSIRAIKTNNFRFLLARLHVDLLFDKITIKDVKLALSQLSKNSETLDNACNKAV